MIDSELIVPDQITLTVMLAIQNLYSETRAYISGFKIRFDFQYRGR